jgi:hypothetical protein
MLSNIELTERLEVLEHEVKILKRTIGMGNLEKIPDADYEIAAEIYPEVPCLHLHWDRDYDNGIRTCKNCGHQEELY